MDKTWPRLHCSGIQGDGQLGGIGRGSIVPKCSEMFRSKTAASIEEFGFTNPVLVGGANGIIAGHGRVLAAAFEKGVRGKQLRLDRTIGTTTPDVIFRAVSLPSRPASASEDRRIAEKPEFSGAIKEGHGCAKAA